MPHIPRTESTRESIARVLAHYYRDELAPPEPDRFSLSALMRRISARTNVGDIGAYEAEVCHAQALASGADASPLRPVVPWRALAGRTLTTTPGASGGYLVSAEPRGELELLLQPYSLLAEAGAHLLDAPAGVGDYAIPVEKSAITGAWITPGTTSATASDSVLGQLPLRVRTFVAVVEHALQLDAQAGPLLDRVLGGVLLSAAGAAADAAAISGAGGAEPTGILHRSDITAQSGTSLSFANVCTMKKNVLAAGAREARLRWLGAPDVQEVLSKRERASGSGMVWEDGKIADVPAVATSRVPAGYLVLADWSTLYASFWNGGPSIETSASPGFNTGVLTTRIALNVDIGFANPGAVTYAASVT